MQAVYVDTRDRSNLEVPFNSRPWGQSVHTDIFPRFDDGGEFAMLQAFMERYFIQSHRRMQAAEKMEAVSDQEDVALTLSVLKLCDLLLHFGSYSSNEEIAHIAWYLYLSLRMQSHDANDEGTKPLSEEDLKKNLPSSAISIKRCNIDEIQGEMTKFIDHIWYTMAMLLITIISFVLGIANIIVAGDDSTEDNLLRYGHGWWDVVIFSCLKAHPCQTIHPTSLFRYFHSLPMFLFCQYAAFLCSVSVGHVRLWIQRLVHVCVRH